MSEFLPGRKVTFIPYEGAPKESFERGIVKSVNDLGSFVVFDCNNLWGNYVDYPAQHCNNADLKSGWL